MGIAGLRHFGLSTKPQMRSSELQVSKRQSLRASTGVRGRRPLRRGAVPFFGAPLSKARGRLPAFRISDAARAGQADRCCVPAEGQDCAGSLLPRRPPICETGTVGGTAAGLHLLTSGPGGATRNHAESRRFDPAFHK